MTPSDRNPKPSTTAPALQDALMAIVDCGVRIAKAAALAAEVEGEIVALQRAQLPERMGGETLTEVQVAGLGVDAADMALALCVPRIAIASRAYQGAARTVRRAAALVQRIEHGWPRPGGADTKHAMARRQIARSVGDRITTHADGEAAERLFDDLVERLDAMEYQADLDRPVEELIAELCRDLGLPAHDAPVPAKAPSPARGRGSG